jgi:hypothetical protein
VPFNETESFSSWDNAVGDFSELSMVGKGKESSTADFRSKVYKYPRSFHVGKSKYVGSGQVGGWPYCKCGVTSQISVNRKRVSLVKFNWNIVPCKNDGGFLPYTVPTRHIDSSVRPEGILDGRVRTDTPVRGRTSTL